MNWIVIAKTVLDLLPALIAVIKALEEAFPAGGQGQLKLDMLRASLQGAYSTANNATLAFETLWPALQSTANNIVATFNATGVFKK